ncbi:Hypothetical predicted protein [Xyrichtys novacula]|uniref:Uncharacterized protein n=1 Tax=Xyrichtys novacula TaxID=13765 RepID=A0AAV1GHJ7_XYRNO|nr:Hypothetical predicted protein [Xyrichtys novacula]
MSATHTESRLQPSFSTKSGKACKNTGTAECRNIIIKDARIPNMSAYKCKPIKLALVIALMNHADSSECAAVQVLCQQHGRVDSLPEAAVQDHPETGESPVLGLNDARR